MGGSGSARGSISVYAPFGQISSYEDVETTQTNSSRFAHFAPALFEIA